MTKYYEHNKHLIDQRKLHYQFDEASNAVVVGPLPDHNSNIVEPKQVKDTIVPSALYLVTALSSL